jgi:NTE family protein
VAFVLSGGGPLGALQVGMLRALFEHGITPDFVVGVSVGALNGVFIAAEPSIEGAEELAQVWMRMRKDDLFPGGRLMSAWHAVRKGTHVFSNDGLRRIIETELGPTNFEDLKMPAHIVAADIGTGDEKWFSTGPILDPLLASSAMPGVFPPVEIEGAVLVDGGIVDNVPVARAIELGAKRVYVLNVAAWEQHRSLQRPHDFMMQGMVVARAQRYRTDLNRLRAQAEVVEFPVVDVGHIPFTNLSNTERLLHAGLEAGRKFLDRGATAGASEALAAPGAKTG